jgi:hypothetical protein
MTPVEFVLVGGGALEGAASEVAAKLSVKLATI